MKIEVYSKKDCYYCILAKGYLKEKGLQFSEFVVGSDLDREQFFEKFPGATTVPQIVVDGVTVGGYEQLTEWMDENDRTEIHDR